jgi:hypothetical protein
MIDLSGLADTDALRSFLVSPTGLFGGREPQVCPPAEPPAALPSSPPARPALQDWTPLSLAGLRSSLEQSAGLSRKKRKKNEEYGELFGHLESAKDVKTAEYSRDPRSQLRLVAHMLGDVALAGSGFDVRLQGGRFSGIRRAGRELMPLHPARSFLRVEGDLRWYRTVSSFSFESDHGTGLREDLRIDGKDNSQVSIEYSFRDDSPLLSIAVDVQFPGLGADSQVDEYAPLAFAVRPLKKGEAARIEVSAPDGSTSSVEVSEEAGSVLAPGFLHRIRRVDGGWIILHFGTPTVPAWGLPCYRVTRGRGSRFLEANPFGSYAPQAGSSVSGRRARYSLRLGLEDA